MLPAHLADRLLKQRRDADTTEFARQLPLHADDPRWMTDPKDDVPFARREPDWATDY
ncbi:hypothetical protein ACIU1J_08950 [Azospirillum doebereinerae]|uniref:hypothetical protein n=1 Tax=Azospirillum doebereinerae TaxID=92933 RepID=UPI001EE52066|nr:hypothetical protein [Azospirillum doebereinerae]MCG5241050.1 hypothetical protein [Azospirillum doebereinerae]